MSLRVFLSGQVVSLLGDGLALLAVPLLTLELTHDPLLAALAASPRYIAYLVVGLVAGALVDRWRPRTVMLVTDGIRAGVFVLMGALASAGQLPPYGPFGLALVAAAAGVFFETALNVVIRDLADERGGASTPLLARASAAVEAAGQAAVVVGPALVGLLAATVGIRAALLVNAATFVASGVTIFAARLPALATAAGVRVRGVVRRVWADVADGFRYLLRERLIRLIAIIQALGNFLIAAETMIVFTAHDVLRLSPIMTSAVVAGSGLGGIAGAALAPRLVALFDEGRVVAACVAVVGGALAAIGASRSAAWLAGANLMIGAAVTIVIVAARTLRLRVVPRGHLGRVTTSSKVIALIPQPLGVVAASTLTRALGGDPWPVFLSAGVLTVVLAAVTAVRLAAVRRADRAPDFGGLAS